ncbi:hypothetical protein JTE90_024111 [Oedothorax gibbosus]|uniref:Uncharacterized protein n=1 Tax=Oedothorax gibbosus TaxID=931172 RepID=A0AAV6UT10_9ARAC|nr:hypothetical protein JTE90_024111 [Oedothorax gibbosus]
MPLAFKHSTQIRTFQCGLKIIVKGFPFNPSEGGWNIHNQWMIHASMSAFGSLEDWVVSLSFVGGQRDGEEKNCLVFTNCW